MRLGKLGATATLVAHCKEHEIDLMPYIQRYESNDWGDLGEEDKHSNNMEMFALAGHCLGKYTLPTGESIYIETTWNNEERQTIVCFPDER